MSRIRFLCMDCDEDTGKMAEFYFVKTEVWLQAAGSIGGMLCVGCLEHRIGRELTPDDFTTAFINNGHWGSKSARLLSRIEGT